MSNLLEDVFAPLYRTPSWNVQKGHGSFLTFEFGAPILETERIVESWPTPFGFNCRHRSAFVHGEWHLWIYLCAWRMKQDGHVMAESDSDDLPVARACAVLNGQGLLSAVAPAAGTTIFRFDLGGCLECIRCPDFDPEDDLWRLYCPDRRVLSLRSDGQYRHESSGQ